MTIHLSLGIVFLDLLYPERVWGAEFSLPLRRTQHSLINYAELSLLLAELSLLFFSFFVNLASADVEGGECPQPGEALDAL